MGEEMLLSAEIENSNIEAQLLLSFVTGLDRAKLLAEISQHISVEKKEHYIQALNRRCGGYPYQYITGIQEFRSRNYYVDERVLIPRPETELLVDEVLKRLAPSSMFLDIGTGSGCIAISIVLESDGVEVYASDISAPALDVAKINAGKLDCSEKIKFIFSSLFDSPELKNKQFDIIASNPPYISEKEKTELQIEVREHEPHSALFAGEKGLDIIGRLIKEAPGYLKKEGFLIFEIAFNQLEEIKKLIDNRIWKLEHISKDFQEIPRIIVMRKK